MSSPLSHQKKTTYVAVLAAGTLLSPFATVLALFLRRLAARSFDSRDSWRGVFAFAVLGSLSYGFLLWYFHPLPALLIQIWQAIRFGRLAAGVQPLLLFWGYHGLLAPLLALLLEALEPKTPPQVRLAPRAVLSRPEDVRQRSARPEVQASSPSSSALPDSVDEDVVIGQAVSGNLWQWVRGTHFVYPQKVLFYHAVMLAQSGQGKSELLRRIAYTLAKRHKMKVFWIDGKGDWKDAARFELTMKQAGSARVGIFPVEAHAGWKGTRQDVLNLLMATQVFESPYYRGITLNILRLALSAPGLPDVSSGGELLRRIYPPTLLNLYQETQDGIYLENLSTDALWGPYNRYLAFFSGVQDRLDGTFGYGDWDAAYYLLDEKRLQEEQAPFARYLIDDFYLYLGLRQAKGKQRPIVLILDDFSSYSSRVLVHKLYERVRSSHGCVILSAQGYEGLGEDAERLLEDAATTIVGKCNLPEKVIRVAGKKKVPAISYHLPQEREQDGKGKEQEEESSTTVREEDRWLVEPDDVRRLEVGEVYVLYGAAAHKVQVARLQLDERLVEKRATELLANYSRTQATSPANPGQAVGSLSVPSKKKKRKKPAPPAPPQPEDGVGRNSDGTEPAHLSGVDSAPPRPPSLDDIE